ncbi:MAG TPA: 4-hydroxy-tetrahydrodipicolinate synthase [Candidatus Cryptobacteroides merdipullorum]|uniref:4-hydroxy-tetrahydrodipicolinate synthase n=1 Tax=Candidatus Cryptobacteroides merdipullorum TaxID=2840771 RepID=A0A9D1KHF8_9BACT|nr:4-hydroxy-tetrahydrodipicolinate synthase [Candidatus Cryptobacteroides merdipullorum]
MNKPYFEGCGTALVTPFTEDYKVDYDAYAASVDRLVKAGVHFLVPLATTGETPTLNAEEKKKLLRITRERVGDMPLLAGCGTNSLDGTLANMELLEDCGADAWLVVVPYYNKPTQEGQYRYFKAVAENSTKPIVIYNVPGRTGANMEAGTVIRLAEDCPKIVGIKEASGRYDQVSEIIRRASGSFSVLSGDDDMTLAFMATGGQGVISVASNVAPAEVSAMCSAMLEGDLKTARGLHHRLFPLFKGCFAESNPVPVKAAMSLLGLMTDRVRLPLSEATEGTKQLMSKIIAELWK